MNQIQTVAYTTNTGRKPFIEWMLNLDNADRLIIISRLHRVENGNLGNCEQLKNASGIWELKIKHGPGYRIYFGKENAITVILLIGGDKGSQERDIKKAEKYWLDYLESIQ